MKRLLCLSLVLLTVLSLCACADNNATTDSTGLPADIMQTEDPKGDDSMNVLFISNSGTSYFTDELYGMLTAAGYEDVNLCQLYYSGCSMKQHYDFWKGGQKPYQYNVTNANGQKSTSDVSLEYALITRNWDYIVFHNSAYSSRSENAQLAYPETEPYLSEMLAYVREQFPLSKYLWMTKWAPDVGYNLSYQMTSVEQRKNIQKTDIEVSELVEKDFGLCIVPCGDAWEKVRDMELFTTPPEGVLGVEKLSMFTRISNGKITDDSIHDG